MTTYYLRFPGGKSKALALSYDDGVEQDARLIGILRAHGMRGTFNLNSALFGKTGRHRRLTGAEALALYDEAVCEVACHGACHGTLTALDTATACLDVLDDRRALETLFGRQIHGMAYANGAVNDAVESLCRSAGLWYGRTAGGGSGGFTLPENWLRMVPTCHHNDAALDDLCARFLALDANKSPKLFTLWGHSYQFDDHGDWDVIERFADRMAGKDDVWYATSMDVFLAVRDYARLERSADGSQVYNPSPRSVWMGDQYGACVEIGPGQSVTV